MILYLWPEGKLVWHNKVLSWSCEDVSQQNEQLRSVNIYQKIILLFIFY